MRFVPLTGRKMGPQPDSAPGKDPTRFEPLETLPDWAVAGVAGGAASPTAHAAPNTAGYAPCLIVVGCLYNEPCNGNIAMCLANGACEGFWHSCGADSCYAAWCGAAGCGNNACGGAACLADGCGGNACGGAACGGNLCTAAACGGDACGGAACGGAICGAAGNPAGACPAAACPIEVACGDFTSGGGGYGYGYGYGGGGFGGGGSGGGGSGGGGGGGGGGYGYGYDGGATTNTSDVAMGPPKGSAGAHSIPSHASSVGGAHGHNTGHEAGHETGHAHINSEAHGHGAKFR
jgi:hypothetical protein